MDDQLHLQEAIEESKRSVAAGKFPAGAVIVLDGKVLAKSISDIHPGYQHAESKAVDKAFAAQRSLHEVTLYASMEPCLMCLSRAYWAGVRRIVFAIPQDALPVHFYEGRQTNSKIVKNLNEKLEYIHLRGMQHAASDIVQQWLSRQ